MLGRCKISVGQVMGGNGQGMMSGTVWIFAWQTEELCQDIRLRVEEIQDLPSMKKYQQLIRKDQILKNICNLTV
jgi:hypothetical protein